jgi:fibronectin type 3 domain-containing protein
MLKTSRFVFTTGLFIFSISAWGQTGNSCDLTLDGRVDAADVQAAINMSLGVSACTADVAGVNACNIVVVQRIINASLGAPCNTSTGLHVVALNWAASSLATGYKVYRGTASGGPYTLLQSLGAVTNFTDTTVASGQTYYYVVTAVNSSNQESSYSNQAQAVISVP